MSPALTRGESVTCKYLFYDYASTNGAIKRIQLPLLQVIIESEYGEEFSTIALVDSGSTGTLLPREIADLLMMNYAEGTVECSGAGGIFNTKQVSLRKLSFLKNKNAFGIFRNVKVLVPDEELILPYIILGRNYVFKRFDITFYEKRRKMKFVRR